MKTILNKIALFLSPEKVSIFVGITSGKPMRLPLKMLLHFLREFWAKYGHFWGTCTPKKSQHFAKNFLHFFSKTLGIRSFHYENFRFCSNFYKSTCKIFRRKSTHFCPRKSSSVPLAGDPGNPYEHRGGRTSKFGQNWANFPPKKSRIFLENFHIFYYPLFVKIPGIQ